MCKTRHETDVLARIPIPYTAPAPAALPRRALDPPYNYIPAPAPPAPWPAGREVRQYVQGAGGLLGQPLALDRDSVFTGGSSSSVMEGRPVSLVAASPEIICASHSICVQRGPCERLRGAAVLVLWCSDELKSGRLELGNTSVSQSFCDPGPTATTRASKQRTNTVRNGTEPKTLPPAHGRMQLCPKSWLQLAQLLRTRLSLTRSKGRGARCRLSVPQA